MCEGQFPTHLSTFAMPSNLMLFWLAAAVCLVAHVAIVRSVFRARQASGRWALDATWAVVPALGLVLILIWTWHVLHAVPPA